MLDYFRIYVADFHGITHNSRVFPRLIGLRGKPLSTEGCLVDMNLNLIKDPSD